MTQHEVKPRTNWHPAPEKKKCRTCGGLGDGDGICERCANCWEVERRLEDYLKSAKGRDFVARALMASIPGLKAEVMRG